MQNLTETNELPFDVAHFQVEELEERFENCWQGEEWQERGYWDPNQTDHFVSNRVRVPCGTENDSDPWRYIDQQ